MCAPRLASAGGSFLETLGSEAFGLYREQKEQCCLVDIKEWKVNHTGVVIVSVSGPDAAKFLQGIITNDIKLLDSGICSLYALFLNTKGRVMCDAILYRVKEDTFFVDCDVSALSMLEKHMKLYRVRSSVNITLADDHRISAVYDPSKIESVLGHTVKSPNVDHSSVFSIMDCNKQIKSLFSENNLHFYNDPRLPILGLRITSLKDVDIENEVVNKDVSIKKTALYTNYRYKLGIGEVPEIPNGVCFPFEINADFLHGISFDKGCYIGQELTARTYHTGIVRKRIMPFYSDKLLTNVQLGAPIENPDGSKVPIGKFLAADGFVGIAIVRVKEALALEKLKMGSYLLKTVLPAWWPDGEQNLNK
ncbi:hypothetical protein AAG570_005618 [Ranatra chinensis]|uniref:Aminomethyltransferase folate-binding domain-containing protein n=1 Tax=Ranatra chinensis TaxID=642074 RepID=A0ABD0XYA9_9HEMI